MKAFTLLLIAGTLPAHDLYLRPDTFRPKPGETVRLEYHNGDSFPESEVPVTIDRLRDTQVLSSAAETPFVNFRIEGSTTAADFSAPSTDGHFILVSRTIPNFIELDPVKFEDYLKHEGLDRIIAWRKQHAESANPGREIYSKYVKALGLIGSPTPDFDRVTGLTIEFVPLADPYRLAQGEKLPVRVLFRGKPAPGLAIEASNAWSGNVAESVVGRTDANGEIRIPVDRPGLWRLHTVYMERLTYREKADWESFWASLTFEIQDARSESVLDQH